MTNSARWVTWKYAAVPPPGQARLDQDIVAQIFLRVRDLYKKDGGKFPDPILNLSWAYADSAHPSLSQVAMELNGKALADLKDDATGQVIKAGQQLPGFAWLKDDGTTMSGNWIYSGMWTEAGSQVQRRGTEDPSGLGFIPTGLGHGLPTVACFTIALPAIQMGSHGIRLASRCGGMKRRGNGLATTCRTSNPTPIPKTIWDLSL